MPLPTAKEIKKLAKACREAGIHYFKGEGFEFTMSGIAPEKPSKRSSPSNSEFDPSKLEEDALSNEELLFWSVDGGLPFSVEEQTK